MLPDHALVMMSALPSTTVASTTSITAHLEEKPPSHLHLALRLMANLAVLAHLAMRAIVKLALIVSVLTNAPTQLLLMPQPLASKVLASRFAQRFTNQSVARMDTSTVTVANSRLRFASIPIFKLRTKESAVHPQWLPQPCLRQHAAHSVTVCLALLFTSALGMAEPAFNLFSNFPLRS